MSQYKEIEKQVQVAIKNGASENSVREGLVNGGYTPGDIESIIQGAKRGTEVQDSIVDSTTIPIKKVNKPDEQQSSPQMLVTKEKKVVPLKALLIIISLLLIGVGGLFAYKKADPFFLKSQEAILGSIITSSQESLKGGYVLKMYNKYIFSDGQRDIEINIPIEYRTKENVKGEFPEQHLLIGDLDISPITEMLFMGEGEEFDSLLNVELKYVNKDFFIIANKIPAIAGMILPVDSIIGKWIKFDLDAVEDMYGKGLPDDIDKETSDKIIAIYLNAIINDSGADISSKREGSGRLITYSANLNDLYQAMDSATDEAVVLLGGENPTMLYENIDGTIKIEIVVNNDFIIEKFDTVVNVQYEDGNIIGGLGGTLVLDESINIITPEETISVEEVWEIVYGSSEDWDDEDWDDQDWEEKNMSNSINISNLRNRAEILFTEDGNYSNTCSYAKYIFDEIEKTGGVTYCQSSQLGYVAHTTLFGVTDVYCVDSTGFAGQVENIFHSNTSLRCN